MSKELSIVSIRVNFWPTGFRQIAPLDAVR